MFTSSDDCIERRTTTLINCSQNAKPSNAGRARVWNGEDKSILRNETTLLTMFQFRLVGRLLTHYTTGTRSIPASRLQL